jgi:hypothetical protein
MLNKMEPRDQLRAAIAEREKRRRCVVSAADALDRANDLLREAETRLATEFADVDRAIAVHHADRVKVSFPKIGSVAPPKAGSRRSCRE